MSTPTEEELVALVIEQGKKRAQAMGEEFNEADYLAGAMVVLSELFGRREGEETACVPAHWVFRIMRGDSVLGLPRAAGQPARRDLLRFVRNVAGARDAGQLDRRMVWEEARELLGLDEQEDED